MKEQSNVFTAIQYRTATPADLPGILDVALSAPDDSMLYRWPGYYSHHDFLRRRFFSIFRERMHNPTTYWHVATVKSFENETVERIVGWTCWMRNLPLPVPDAKTKAVTKAKYFNNSVVATVNNALVHLEFLYDQTLHNLSFLPSSYNPVQNMTRSRAFVQSQNKLTPSVFSLHPSYVLITIDVHESFQNRGIGQALMRWGMTLGAEEGVPVFTKSQGRSMDFYRNKLAFSVIPESKYWLDSDGNETDERSEAWKQKNGGIHGGSFIWCPKGVRVDILDRVYEGDGKGLSQVEGLA